MSGYLAGKVWRSALPGTLKPLAACLADFANHDGSGVYPSVGYLMWMLDAGESTIRRQMVELRQAGILIPVANEKGGRGKVPVYRIDEDQLPSRPPYRDSLKGLKNDTLSVKGLKNDMERVSKTTLKGLKNDSANKEDPSVEPSVLTLSPPSSEQIDSLKQAKKRQPDSRHQPFRKTLEKFWVYENPNEAAPNWSVADAGQLGRFLKDWPTLTKESFTQWLRNYDKSEGINTSLRPYQILPRLHEYSQGPLNQFRKPLEENHASA